MSRTWTDDEVRAHKSHTEDQLRKIINDRDAKIIELKMLLLKKSEAKDAEAKIAED